MEKENKENDVIEGLDYGVANALFLMSTTLGEDYEQNKESPFSEDFILSENLTQVILNNAKQKLETIGRPFLENQNANIAKCFGSSLEVSEELITRISQNFNNGEYATNDGMLEVEIKQMLEILKARKKLLGLFVEKLKKDSHADAFSLYKEVVGVSKHLDDILAESYQNKIDIEKALFNFVEYCKGQAKIKKLQNKQIKDHKLKAEEILETTKELTKEDIKEQELSEQEIEQLKLKKEYEKNKKITEEINNINKNNTQLF